MKLVFVRHGESEANAEGRLQGHAEFKLSEEGRTQSQRLSERFQKKDFRPTHIYSSPQQRAAETARIVAASWPVPIVHWDELKEFDVGIFTGLTWDEIGIACSVYLYPAQHLAGDSLYVFVVDGYPLGAVHSLHLVHQVTFHLFFAAYSQDVMGVERAGG